MTSINFYHLTTTGLFKALPKILEKALSANFRVLLTVESEARLAQLDKLLWEYEATSFLPHGRADEPSPESQLILLSASLEPLNNANLLLVSDGREIEDFVTFERVIDIFDGSDAEQVSKARTRWKKYKDGGHEMVYFKQNERGGWEKG